MLRQESSGSDALGYESLVLLRRTHPGWRLLCADSAPLIASFVFRAFIQPNVRALPQAELASALEDYLYQLRERLGAEAFPRRAAQYLDDWAHEDHAWLRKYYPPGADEPHFDLAPATEKAVEWLRDLPRRHLVATESRLLTVFELLRQIAHGTEEDPRARIAELERRRSELDGEIERLRAGKLDLMDEAQVRDRFLQMEATARGLLSDFRAVEQNFRDLDRAARERMATWEGSKGALLDEVFGDRDAINDSDQGKTFRAFWDFLMSPARQEELTALLETVMALPAIRSLAPDPRLRRVHYDWQEAGEVAQRTVARLSEQLRRYLDDQAHLENRRVMQLLREVEQHALAVRQAPPGDTFIGLDDLAPTLELAFDRPLFSPRTRPALRSAIQMADGSAVPADALYQQVYVDRERLAGHIRRALHIHSPVSLSSLIASHPLEQGLAELVAYLSLAAEDSRAVIDDRTTQTVSWVDSADVTRVASVPLILFHR